MGWLKMGWGKPNPYKLHNIMKNPTLQNLIQELCPDGVEFKKLGEVIKLQKGKQLNKELLSESG